MHKLTKWVIDKNEKEYKDDVALLLVCYNKHGVIKCLLNMKSVLIS